MRIISVIISCLFFLSIVSCSDNPVEPADNQNGDQSGENGNGDPNGDTDGPNGDEPSIEYCCIVSFGGLLGDGSVTRAYDMVTTSDGGYVITGHTTAHKGDFEWINTQGRSAVFLMKLDENLEVVWIRTIGGTSGDNTPYAMSKTPDGGFVISGHFGSNDGDFEGMLKGNHAVFIWKTDADGQTEWLKGYGGTDWEYGRSIDTTSDGGYIIAGYSGSDNLDFRRLRLGRNYIFLMKLNGTGGLEWIKPFGIDTPEARNYGEFVTEGPDGGFLVTGTFTNGDAVIIKTNPEGVQEWIWKRERIDRYVGVKKIEILDNDRMLVAGQNILMEMTADGEVLWEKHLGLDITDITILPDGSFTATGTASDNEEIFREFNIYNRHMSVLHFSADGTLNWKNTIGGDHSDSGKSIVKSSDGGYLLAGRGSSDERVLAGFKKGTHDYLFVVKVDENGRLFEKDS
jgi:hypothetical protein